MRHFWFKIAVENNCLFIPILVQSTQCGCRERNKNRSKPVPNSSMTKIFEKFEKPGSEYYETNLKITDFNRFPIFVEEFQEHIEKSEFIQMKEQTKQITEQSESHNLDQEMRKVIAQILKSCSPSARPDAARKLAQLKKEFLKQNLAVDKARTLLENSIN